MTSFVDAIQPTKSYSNKSHIIEHFIFIISIIEQWTKCLLGCGVQGRFNLQ